MITQRTTYVAGCLLLLVTTAVLQACAGHEPSTAAESVGDRAASVALKQLGTPYRYGGDAPTGFDCSGLVHYAYTVAGKAVPRTTRALWRTAEPVADRDLRRGDLLFFRFDGKLSHVGMYIGNDRFVHAPSSGKFVAVEDLRSGVYRRAFVGAGRLR